MTTKAVHAVTMVVAGGAAVAGVWAVWEEPRPRPARAHPPPLQPPLLVRPRRPRPRGRAAAARPRHLPVPVRGQPPARPVPPHPRLLRPRRPGAGHGGLRGGSDRGGRVQSGLHLPSAAGEGGTPQPDWPILDFVHSNCHFYCNQIKF